MRIDIITGLPQLLKGPLSESIVKRAQKKRFAEIIIHDLRDYTKDRRRTIDDKQYGGGAGMVLKVEPVANLIEKLKSERTYDEIIYTSPDGESLNQKMVNRLSLLKNIIILCGHYKGVDQRIRDLFITREVSIGDYVLSGGELAAAVLCDAIVRLIPGVLNDGTSALTDSFQDNLLAPPVYTRPATFKSLKVPQVLLSGNEKMIEKWREEQSLLRTKQKRPDILNKAD